jgi:hypothetical protein
VNNNSGSVVVDLEQNGASFDELLMRPGLRWDENIAAVVSFICMYMYLRMYGLPVLSPFHSGSSYS